MLFAALAFVALSKDPIMLTVYIFAVIAVVSATHDASIDGYYLEALNKKEQALFVGVRNTAYRLAMIFTTGGMVWLAGYLSQSMGKHSGWMLSFVILTAVMGTVFSIHSWYLPSKAASPAEQPLEGVVSSELEISNTSEPITSETQEAKPDRNYIRAIFSYFKQPGIVAIVFYILLFRLGDALVMKMIPSFLKDPVEKAGMGLSTQEIGIVYGTVGITFLLLGGIAGGYLVSKGGLKRWLWPTTLFMNGAILLYYLLGLFHPSIIWVYVVNSIEQFGYGIGMAAYTVFLLTTVKQEYKAAHYAVATAMQATGVMLPGMASGYMVDGFTIPADTIKAFGLSSIVGDGAFHYAGLGYTNFFLVSFLLSFPGIISIFFLPIWRKEPNTAAS